MKMLFVPRLILCVPVAVCLAQTPPPAAAPAAPAAQPPKAAITLEDIPGADPVVLTVGEERMTKSQFERLLAALPDQIRARAQQPGGKRQIAEQVVQLKSMAQEARKRGIDKTPESRELIAFQTDSVLANTLYREISNGIKPDDAAARAYYDQHKADYEEVKARHILIRFKGSPVPAKPEEKELTEAEALAKAQELRKRIVAGEDFAKIATAESADTSSAKMGGSLGEGFGKGRMVPQFEEAAFKQPVGEVGEPVKTQFGYHIIQVEKRETAPFERVKPTIEKNLKPELTQQAVDNIRKQAGVNLNDAYFGAPAAK